MLMEGVASARDIDKALKLGLNHPMGPFELVDLVGLDTRLSILEYLHQSMGEKYRPCPLLVQYVQAGRLGKKVGQGRVRVLTSPDDDRPDRSRALRVRLQCCRGRDPRGALREAVGCPRARDGPRAALGLVRAGPHRDLRQAHRLRGRPIARRGRAARLRGRGRAARRTDACASIDARWHDAIEVDPAEDRTRASSGWANYVAVVARRLASNFPGADLGADLAMRAICRARPASAARARSSSAWPRRSSGAPGSTRGPSGGRRSRPPLDLAGYLGAVENGLTFKSLAGHERRRHARRQRGPHGDSRRASPIA